MGKVTYALRKGDKWLTDNDGLDMWGPLDKAMFYDSIKSLEKDCFNDIEPDPIEDDPLGYLVFYADMSIESFELVQRPSKSIEVTASIRKDDDWNWVDFETAKKPKKPRKKKG